ncbi:MAG: DUF4160 domain-containing protein [Prosthecobacter sp.]|nr:DUF4160 domain-containing protein [Prosthecobacter sp.]
MPTVSRFRNIKIEMYFHDHSPPHFHAKLGNHRALCLLDGSTRERCPAKRRSGSGNGRLSEPTSYGRIGLFAATASTRCRFLALNKPPPPPSYPHADYHH